MTDLFDIIKRACSYVAKSLQHEPRLFIYFLWSFVIGTKPAQIIELSAKDTIQQITKGKSLIRIGDGESMLIMGRSIPYQAYAPPIKTGLDRIIADYQQTSRYIVAIPTFALVANETELRKQHRMRIWRLFRVLFKHRFNQSLPYADAVMFYQQGFFETNFGPLLKHRHVIVVTRASTLDTTLQTYINRAAMQSTFIVAPSTDSFSHINQLRTDIDTAINTQPNTSPLILIAIGPASKLLAYEYASRDIQVIDIGHGMEIIGRNIDYSQRI